MSNVQLIADALKRAGGYIAVARVMKLNPETVRVWRATGRVPAERVVEFERITGAPREKVRPDLYRKAAA